MSVLGNVAVAEMPALGVPDTGIAIVAARVLAVDRGLGRPVWPDFRHAMGSLDPATETPDVFECRARLRPVREADDFDLDGGIPVGLNASRRVPQRPRRLA